MHPSIAQMLFCFLHTVCYNFNMKRKAALLCAIAYAVALIFALCACADNENRGDIAAIADSAEPQSTPLESDAPAAYGTDASASVTATAAYSYKKDDENALYVAIEYENTGDCPITISNVELSASCNGISESTSFVPELNEYMILLPGETGYIARWLADTAIPEGGSVMLDARLTIERSTASGIRISVDRLYTADNYPTVTTLSGRLICADGQGCSANMIFVGFYDEAGDFIGAWYFSKNALFDALDSKSFVVNMNGFPVDNLSQKAASIRGIGFGFDF